MGQKHAKSTLGGVENTADTRFTVSIKFDNFYVLKSAPLLCENAQISHLICGIKLDTTDEAMAFNNVKYIKELCNDHKCEQICSDGFGSWIVAKMKDNPSQKSDAGLLPTSNRDRIENIGDTESVSQWDYSLHYLLTSHRSTVVFHFVWHLSCYQTIPSIYEPNFYFSPKSTYLCILLDNISLQIVPLPNICEILKIKDLSTVAASESAAKNCDKSVANIDFEIRPFTFSTNVIIGHFMSEHLLLYSTIEQRTIESPNNQIINREMRLFIYDLRFRNSLDISKFGHPHQFVTCGENLMVFIHEEHMSRFRHATAVTIPSEILPSVQKSDVSSVGKNNTYLWIYQLNDDSVPLKHILPTAKKSSIDVRPLLLFFQPNFQYPLSCGWYNPYSTYYQHIIRRKRITFDDVIIDKTEKNNIVSQASSSSESASPQSIYGDKFWLIVATNGEPRLLMLDIPSGECVETINNSRIAYGIANIGIVDIVNSDNGIYRGGSDNLNVQITPLWLMTRDELLALLKPYCEYIYDIMDCIVRFCLSKSEITHHIQPNVHCNTLIKCPTNVRFVKEYKAMTLFGHTYIDENSHFFQIFRILWDPLWLDSDPSVDWTTAFDAQ